MKAQFQYILGDEDTMLLTALLQAMHRLRNFYDPAALILGDEFEGAQAAWNTVTQQKEFTWTHWAKARKYVAARVRSVEVHLRDSAVADPVRVELEAASLNLLDQVKAFQSGVMGAYAEYITTL